MRRRRMTIQALAVVLVATVVPGLAAPAVASAAGPSVDPPVVKSAPVARQVTTAQPQDSATRNALQGDQDPRADRDGAGTHKATTLAPSAVWDVSEQTGDFVWSYPLRVPPTPGGLVPQLALAYRSSAVDGHTSATNNQPSWVGDGWDLSVGFVERAYGGCADDTEGGSTPPKTGDLCWRSNNATASFDGGGGMLIHNEANKDWEEWRTKSDNGSRIERLTGAGNGDENGEHWKITTVDGTQYWFGSQGDSNSTWTVPVFGDDANEPCHGNTFESSRCTQAWRWNLDKVIDRNGNLIRYFYETESNKYGLNLKDAGVDYIRGGTLKRIEYGLHEGLGGAPGGQVEFGTADRCYPGSDCRVERPGNWPDTPLDQRCVADNCPKLYTPSFWSTKRLTTITTRVWNGSSYSDVDRWALDQQFPDPGDGEKPALWLKGITHTGLVGGSIELPAVTFEGEQLPNRVYRIGDGLAPLIRYRITGVVTESGGVTSITYAAADCDPDGWMAQHPEHSTMRCFPVRWAKKDYAERTDLFHKYVVDRVIQSDRLSTSTQMVTRYEYLDGAAWHWDMSEFTKDEKKTWNEFRGFGRVRTRIGAVEDPAGPVTMLEQRYYRGMDGDRLPSGTRPVTVTDSEGGARTDHDWLTGVVYESATYEREAPSAQPTQPPVVRKTITDPFWNGPTATRGVYKAYIVRPAAQRELVALKSGGWRTTRIETSYDDLGFPTSMNDLGDVATPADDRCVRTWYRRDTGRWLLNLPSRTETVAVACTSTPRFPEHAISAARTSYDDSGNLTKTEVAAERPAADPVYVTTSTARHDAHGRITEATDAAGNTTRSGFTPATGGPVAKTTTTTPPTPAVPAGLVTTTEVEPASGQAKKIIDANNRVTEFSYDALGRKLEVWLPNRPKASNTRGNFRFAYLVRRDEPTAVTSWHIGPNGNFTSSTTLFDGLLRARQVQSVAVGGGRLLTDTRYDSHGRAFKKTQPYFNDAAVDDQLWVASDTEVPGLTRSEFDGAGREVASVYQTGAFEKSRTTTEYDGDRVHVTPRRGASATTAIADARGQTTELRQYHGSTPTGAYDATRYRYDATGHLTEIVSAGGATWKFGYDLRGRQIRSEDPDRGASTSTFDNLGRVVSTRDGRGITLAHAYDSLGRKTALYKDSSSGPKLAEWTYDTARAGKGQVVKSTRFVDGHAYTSSVYSYTALYQPTEVTVSIPAVEGLLAGDYTWTGDYGWDGSLSGETYPKAGGLDRETVNYEQDDWARPLTTSGSYDNATVELVTDTKFTRYGEVERIQLGAGSKRSWLSYYYDSNTRRLNRSIVDAELPAPMQSDTHYTYDDAGNITAIADKTIGQTADNQCFRYDHLRRLTEAWTPTSDCASNPTVSGLGGPAPYWHSYRYDRDGNRMGETRHAANGDITRTYTYPAPNQPQPHGVRSITTTTPGGGTATDTYTYDGAGNTTGRTKAGLADTLSWDAEGNLASATKNEEAAPHTSYVYATDGSRLIRRDPTGTTLYLGKQEIRLARSGGSPVATRYYTHGGQAIAVRQGATLTWMAGDHQATAQVAINSDTQQVARRRQLPFGGPRGESLSPWPDDHGFLGGTQDSSTGLTHLGAREYDPDTGRFMSVDPILDLNDPQQWNAYAYANNSPITFADPSGMILSDCADSSGSCNGLNPWTGAPKSGGGSGGSTKSKGVSLVGVGKDAIAEARGRAADIAVVAKRNGYRTTWVIHDITVPVHNGSSGFGLPSEYTMVPGIIIALSFDPVVQCFDPVDPRTPTMGPTPMTRAELAQWEAAQKRLQKKPAAAAFWEFIGEITGVNAIIDCIDKPSFGRCMEAGASAAGPISKGVSGAIGAVRGLKAARTACSFDADTEVLLADGTTKPISEIEVGDQVLAADPETGERGPRTVTAVLPHQDVVLELATEDGATVTTTEDHPYYNETDKEWQRADRLDSGDYLSTADGTSIRVGGLRFGTQRWDTAYDLSVAGLHTYFVLIRTAPVLVHNCPAAGESSIRIQSDDFSIWATVNGSGDFARAQRSGDTVSVSDVFRVDQEAVRGSDLVAAVLYAHRVKSGETVMISNIINEETVAAFHRGDPASASLLGRTGASALGKLGLSPTSVSWHQYRGKLNIAISVG